MNMIVGQDLIFESFQLCLLFFFDIINFFEPDECFFQKLESLWKGADQMKNFSGHNILELYNHS